MRLSRRSLLGTGAAALAAGGAGCIGGPGRFTQLSASVRAPFDAGPSATVPVTVEAYVQNVDSDVAALEGVTAACYDADREQQTEAPLGDFAWRDADPERRQVEERDTGFLTTTTVYSAGWTVETELEVEVVPEWITFDVAAVRFDDEEVRSGVAPVGRARASQPPPIFTAYVEAYDGDRPAPSTVRPEDYRSLRLASDRELAGAIDGPGPILPPAPTTTPTASGSGTGTESGNSTTNGTGTENGTTSTTRTRTTTTRTRTATADGSDD